jgi:hypothetical protein
VVVVVVAASALQCCTGCVTLVRRCRRGRVDVALKVGVPRGTFPGAPLAAASATVTVTNPPRVPATPALPVGHWPRATVSRPRHGLH